MIGRKKGDAIEGDKILCQARRIEKHQPPKGTHRHRTQTASLDSIGREAAFCVVEKEFRFSGAFKL